MGKTLTRTGEPPVRFRASCTVNADKYPKSAAWLWKHPQFADVVLPLIEKAIEDGEIPTGENANRAST